MAAKIDLSKFSILELSRFYKEIEGEIKTRKEGEKKKVREKMRELAASIGMTVEEVVGTKAEKKTKGKVPLAPKYRNPENPEQTWIGRGQRPAWLKEALKKGMKLEGLEIR